MINGMHSRRWFNPMKTIQHENSSCKDLQHKNFPIDCTNTFWPNIYNVEPETTRPRNCCY